MYVCTCDLQDMSQNDACKGGVARMAIRTGDIQRLDCTCR